MSVQFSDTTNRKGLVQLCEDWCGFNPGDISGNPTLLSQFTAWMNLGLDDVWSLILLACGLGQLDDTNFADYPFFSMNLVSGQRDYPYDTDGDRNVILSVNRVMCADPSGIFHEIYPVNQETTTQKTGNVENTDTFYNGQNASGTPSRYSRNANSIFLDVIPNYNSVGGLLMFGDREASYFVSGDTMKKPGFVGIFQSYPALFASEMYAGMRTLDSLKKLNADKMNMQRAIQLYYATRNKDAPKRLLANVENTR